MSESDYTAGMAAGIMAMFVGLGVLALGAQVVRWLMRHPQPQALTDWLTAARFSVFDVVTMATFVGALVLAVVFLPRRGGGR
jgi:hypothetical protein